MEDLAVSDLIDLVAANVNDADSRIQKMFEWHFARDLEIAKWVLGAAASFAVAFGVALFSATTLPAATVLVTMVIVPLGTATFGFVRLYRMRSIHRQYVAALKLLAQIRSVQPFIHKYRGSGE